jgi:hypothetical protein
MGEQLPLVIAQLKQRLVQLLRIPHAAAGPEARQGRQRYSAGKRFVGTNDICSGDADRDPVHGRIEASERRRLSGNGGGI